MSARRRQVADSANGAMTATATSQRQKFRATGSNASRSARPRIQFPDHIRFAAASSANAAVRPVCIFMSLRRLRRMSYPARMDVSHARRWSGLMVRLLAVSLLLAPTAWAGRLQIPLHVPLPVVQRSLATQLPAAPDAIYREGPCRHLTLDAPALTAAGGEVRLSAPGSAAMGVELFGRCQSAADWQGTLQARLEPRIDEAGRLRLRIVDSRLVDSRGRKGVPLVWRLARSQVPPRLEAVSYDLGVPREALVSVLHDVAPGLGSVQLLQPRIEANQIVVPLAIEFPDAWLASAAAGATARLAPAAPL